MGLDGVWVDYGLISVSVAVADVVAVAVAVAVKLVNCCIATSAMVGFVDGWFEIVVCFECHGLVSYSDCVA